MNKEILNRLEELERKMNPKDTKVKTMFPGDEEERIVTMPEFIARCRKDSQIYSFKIVSGENLEQMDSFIGLIDDYAFGNL